MTERSAGHPGRRRTTARDRSREREYSLRDDVVRASLGSRLRRNQSRPRTCTAGARAISVGHLGISLLLGFGIAATTTLFAFVDAVLLRPLPYDQPDRLVMIWESNVRQNRLREGGSPGNILDWVARNDAFDAITAMLTVSATLRGQDGGTPISGVMSPAASSMSIVVNQGSAALFVRTNSKVRRRSRHGSRPAASRSSFSVIPVAGPGRRS